MAADGSTRAVLYALGANTGIAITKFAAAAYTGSGSMLAEGIHSLADCGNQGLLLLGMKRAQRPATADHPLGHHRVVYFYSMMVAVLLFFVGGLFSVYEGVHRALHPGELHQPVVALVVLGVAIVLEAFSLWGAMREIRKVQHGRSFMQWFRETRESVLMVIAGEDIAALGGLVLAFVAVAASMLTGNPLYDALGSVAIGVLLVIVAIAVMLEVKGMIVGESAEPRLRAEIEAWIVARPEVDEVIRIVTLQWGEKLVVSVQAKMRWHDAIPALITDINRVEDELKRRFPQVGWTFFEPDVPHPPHA